MTGWNDGCPVIIVVHAIAIGVDDLESHRPRCNWQALEGAFVVGYVSSACSFMYNSIL